MRSILGAQRTKHRARKATAITAVASLLASGLVAAGIGMQMAAAQEWSPSVSVRNVTSAGKDFVLAGDNATFEIATSNQSGGAQFNLGLTALVPNAVHFQSASSLGVPTQYASGIVLPNRVGSTAADCAAVGLVAAPVPPGPLNRCAVPEGMQLWVWSDVNDLPQGATVAGAVTVRPDAAAYPVGTEIPFSVNAYTSNDPTKLPTFNGSNSVVVDRAHTSAPGHDTADAPVKSLRVTKTEPSAEQELLRGAHTNVTTYTITVENSGQGPTDDAVVVDYLPAGLEFLDAATENSTAGDEYPASGPLLAAPSTPAPSSVETVSVTPSEATALNLPGGGVYTKVTWTLGELTGGSPQTATGAATAGVTTITYRAAVPLFENEMWPEGAAPDPAGLTQGANLDNNTGPSTRQGSDDEPAEAQAMTNVASASGVYSGAVLDNNEALRSSSDHDDVTISAVDLRVLKSVVDRVDFTAGRLATYRLDIAVSEYVDASGITLTDVIPNGLCPAFPEIGAAELLIDGAPADGAAWDFAVDPGEACDYPTSEDAAELSGLTLESIDYITADGTFVVTFGVADIAAGRDAVGQYTVMQRPNYTGAQGGTSSGDSFVNNVTITGTTTSISQIASEDDLATRVGGAKQAKDDSSASIGSDLTDIQKHVLARGVALGDAGDADWQTEATDPFSPGDTVWYRVTVHFAQGIDTRNPKLSDYLPVGVKYVDSTSTVTGATADHVPAPSIAGNVLTWNFGTQRDGAGDYFMPAGSVVELYIEGSVVGQSASAEVVDSPQNHAKYQQVNVEGRVAFERASAAIDLDWGSTLRKGIQSINGVAIDGAGFGSRSESQQVVQGDTVVYNIDVTAPQNDTTDYVIWDVLPEGLKAADVGSFTADFYDAVDGTRALTGFDAEAFDPADMPEGSPALVGEYAGRSVIAWNVSSRVPGSTAATDSSAAVVRGFTLGYTLTVPSDQDSILGGAAALLEQSYSNTAGIVSYDIPSNGGSASTIVPQATTPGQELTNRTPTPGEIGVSDVDTYDSAEVHLPGAVMSKDLIGTEIDAGGNGAAQIAQGELATYEISVTIPANTTVRDGVLADGGRVAWAGNPNVSGRSTPYVPVGAQVWTAPGVESGVGTLPADFAFDSVTGALTFPQTFTAGSENVTLAVRLVMWVDDRDASNAGRNPDFPHSKPLTNIASFVHDDVDGVAVTQQDTAVVTYVEPNLAVVKNASPSTGVKVGDPVTYSIAVSNSASRPSTYDNTVVDTVPAGIDVDVNSFAVIIGAVTTPLSSDDLVFTGDIATGGGGTVTFDPTRVAGLATIAGGASVTLRYTAEVSESAAAGQSYTNTADVTGYTLPATIDGVDTTDRSGDRVRSDDATITAVTAVIGKGVRIGNSGAYAPVAAAPIGETASYEVSITLNPNINYYNARITDQLPAGVTLVGDPTVTVSPAGSVPEDWDWTNAGGRIEGTYQGAGRDIPSLGQARVLTITYQADLTNVVAADVDRLVNTAGFSWTQGENGARQVLTWTATVDVLDPTLTIDKSVDGVDAITRDPDASFEYTVEVRNTGETPAHAITVTDTVPAGVIVDADTLADSGGVLTGVNATTGGGTITWTIEGPLAVYTDGASPDQVLLFTYDARFADSMDLSSDGAGLGVALRNTAEVTHFESFDDGGREYDPTDVTDEATAKPLFPHVDLTKEIVATDEAFVDEAFSWKLAATNSGPGAAQTVVLTDTLPENWSYDETVAPVIYVGGVLLDEPAAPTVDTVNGRQTLAWTFGDETDAALPGTASGATGAARTVTVQFSATPGEDALERAGAGRDIDHINSLSATVTDSTGAEENRSGSFTGDDATATAHIARADLLLEKAAAGGVLDAGAEGAAGNLYGLDAGAWIPGQPVIAGSYAQPQWRITITNQEPDAAHGPFAVVDTQVLSDGTTPGAFSARYYANAADTAGTPLDLSGTGTDTDPYIIGDNGTTLADGGADRIVLVADVSIASTTSVDPDDAPTNAASVTGRTFETPADIEKDNQDSATNELTARADLEVAKTVSTTDPNAGSSMTWGITVRNLGPSLSLSSAENPITVTDTVPDGVGAVLEPSGLTGWTVAASDGWPAAAGDTITWTFAGNSITVDGTHTLGLTGTIASSWTADITNSVIVSSRITEDPNDENDSSTVTITPDIDTELGISKTRVTWDGTNWVPATASDVVRWGDPVSYRVTVVNNGPADAQGVAVVDEVPEGLTYNSHESDGDGTWDRSAGGANAAGTSDPTWDTFELDGTQGVGADNARSYVVTYDTDETMESDTGIDNWVEVSASNATNAPRDDDSTSSDRVADLSVVKSHVGSALAGTTLDYTIVVTNNGPSVSDAPIVVTDVLPAGFSYVAGTASVTVAGAIPARIDPVIDGQTLTWTPIADATMLAAGATIEIALTTAIAANLPAQPALVNTARVDGPNDPDPTNDQWVDPTDVITESTMTIVKDVQAGPWVAGTEITYTITVNNTGPSTADAAIRDVLPAGLTAVSLAGADWTCDDDTETCIRVDHPVGTSTITVTALVDADAPVDAELVNTATLTWSDSRSAEPHELSDTAQITVSTDADLSLAKRAVDTDGQTVSRAVAGSPVLYELVATNHGPSDAVAPLTVTDTLPIGIRFASLVSTTDWTAVASDVGADVAQTVVFTRNPASVGVLNGADAPKILFETFVDPSVAQDSTLVNTATVDSGTLDTNPSNDGAESTITVDARSDLGITKSNVGTPVAGEDFEWTIEVTNHGVSDSLATVEGPILVTDQLPDGVTFVSASGPSGTTCDTAAAEDGSFTCAITSTMEPGDSSTMTVRVRVAEDATGTLRNTATVAPGATPEPSEPVYPNEAVNVTPPVIELADLAIEKTVTTDPANIVAGEQISWQLTVTNLGPANSDATAEDPIVVTDTMPEGTTIDSITGPHADWSCEPMDGAFTCELSADLATGDPQVITVTATIDPSRQGTLTNVASVAPGLTPQPTDSEDNDIDRTQAIVTESADLRLLKDVSEEIVAGATGRYTVQVFNDGPSAARDVVITDMLPDTLAFERVITPEGEAAAWACTADASDAQTVLCEYTGTVLPGPDPVTLEIEVSADADLTGDVVNTAAVTSSTPDPDPRNNEDAATGPFVTLADLEIVKSHDPAAQATAGEEFTWQLTVTNNGPSDSVASEIDPIRISDVLAAGTSFVSSSTEGASVCAPDADDPQLVVCDITETIASGDAVSIDIVVVLDEALSGELQNTAVVVPGLTVDPESGNNDGEDIILVTEVADLTIVKSVVTPSAEITAGEDITWAVTVTNDGPSNSDVSEDDPITMTDVLPAGVSFVSATGSGWTCEASETTGQERVTVVCEYPADLPVGDAPAITITGHIAPDVLGDVVNDVSIAPGLTPEPADGNANNTASAVAPVATSADLVLTKVVSDTLTAGSAGAYAFTVTNLGPSAARGITLVDELPEGVSFASVATDGSSEGWTCTPASGSSVVDCVFDGVLTPAASLTLAIEVAADEALQGDIVNTAVVSSETPDSNPENNSASATGTVAEQVDLAIVKTAVGDAQIGESLVYELVVTNSGPATARGVLIEDLLPDGLAVVAAAGDGWSCAADATTGQVACALPELAAGETAAVISVEVTVQPAAYPDVSNTATVSTTTSENPETLTDNTSSVTVPVPPLATLTVTKAAVGEFQVGRPGEYSITVRNDGPTEDVGPITVTDVLPNGLSFASASENVVAEAGVVTWTLPDGLAVHEEVILSLHVNVSEGAYPTVENTVSTDSSTGQTPDAVLSSTATVDVEAAEPLALTGGQVAGGLLISALVLMLLGGTAVVRRRREVAAD